MATDANELTQALLKNGIGPWTAPAGAPRCRNYAKDCENRPVPAFDGLCLDCWNQANRERVERDATQLARVRQSCFATVPEDCRWPRLNDESVWPEKVLAKVPLEETRRAYAALTEGRALRLTFRGPAGSGKTCLAIACFWELVQTRLERVSEKAVFVDAPELGWASRRTRLGEDIPALVAAKEAKVVVLDDVGGEIHCGQGAIAAVGELIRDRHRTGRVTVYTTGLEDDELAKVYGAGVARRLFERAAVVRMGGGTR